MDAWLTKHNLGAIADSQERAVLVSLAYNSLVEERAGHANKGFPVLLGLKLRDAIASGNRAEAWYEIRYNSNGDVSDGIAKRRYYESELFGLRGANTAPMNLAEATNIYQMFTRHRSQILAYEQTYGEGQADASNRIKTANAHYGLTGTAHEVKTLEASFQQAYQLLHDQYIKSVDTNLVIDYRDIQIGNGTANSLSGTVRNGFVLNSGAEKNDLLLGEGGDDALLGGGDPENVYYSLDGQFVYTLVGTLLTVSTRTEPVTPNKQITLKDFSSGQLGIVLLNEENASSQTVLNGSDAHEHILISQQGARSSVEIVNDTTPAVVRNHSPALNTINALGGDDRIIVEEDIAAMTYYGGDGHDFIDIDRDRASAGNTSGVIENGSFLYGEAGDDFIFDVEDDLSIYRINRSLTQSSISGLHNSCY